MYLQIGNPVRRACSPTVPPSGAGAAGTQVPQGPVYGFLESLLEATLQRTPVRGSRFFAMESLILAQNERWRHGLGMQVERAVFRKRDGQWRKGE